MLKTVSLVYCKSKQIVVLDPLSSGFFALKMFDKFKKDAIIIIWKEKTHLSKLK